MSLLSTTITISLLTEPPWAKNTGLRLVFYGFANPFGHFDNSANNCINQNFYWQQNNVRDIFFSISLFCKGTVSRRSPAVLKNNDTNCTEVQQRRTLLVVMFHRITSYIVLQIINPVVLLWLGMQFKCKWNPLNDTFFQCRVGFSLFRKIEVGILCFNS